MHTDRNLIYQLSRVLIVNGSSVLCDLDAL